MKRDPLVDDLSSVGGSSRPAAAEEAAVAQAKERQSVFLDPSGRRWRRFRITLLVILLTLGVAAGIALPQLYASPALQDLDEPLGPTVTSADTGLRTPLVGEGPLVRVLSVRREGGLVLGKDPFTGERKATFSAAEVNEIGSSRFAIQRYGYSPTVSRTISLTFDDGPDPVWTPELLNLLSANKVPATFFSTATMIAKYPELFEREVREGHAVANHSLTHVDVSTTNETRARIEIVASDRVIRAATGRAVGYFGCPTRATTLRRRSSPSMASCARNGSGTSWHRTTSTRTTGRTRRVSSREPSPCRSSTAGTSRCSCTTAVETAER